MTCNVVVVQQPGKPKVTLGGNSRTPIILSRSTVAKINANRPAVRALAQSTPVRVIESDTNLTVGGQGLQGPRGAPGGSVPAIAFSFGDPSHDVFTATSAGVLSLVEMAIDTPFNGSSASVTLGTLADPTLAFPAFAADLTDATDGYEFGPELRMAPGDKLRVSINPGSGGSAGSGYFLLTFFPD